MLFAAILLFAAALVTFGYRVATAKDRDSLFMFVCFLAIGAVYFYFRSSSAVPVLLSGIVIFDGLLYTYGKRLNFAYVAMSILFVAFFHQVGMIRIAQAMLFGLLGEVNIFRKSQNRAGRDGVEMKRDIVQIVGGGFLIAVFYFVGSGYGYLFLVGVIVLGILLVNYTAVFKRTALAKTLYRYERAYTTFGQGAIWLALGSLIAVSFAPLPYSVAILGCLYVGDSLATIVGLAYGTRKLPYNRHKSWAGTLAYAVSAFAVALLFIHMAWIALIIAVVAAIVESAPRHIDDNFDVAAVLVVLIFLLGIAGLL